MRAAVRVCVGGGTKGYGSLSPSVPAGQSFPLWALETLGSEWGWHGGRRELPASQHPPLWVAQRNNYS